MPTRKCAIKDCDKMVDYSGCRHKAKYRPEHRQEVMRQTQIKCHRRWVECHPMATRNHGRKECSDYEPSDYGVLVN